MSSFSSSHSIRQLEKRNVANEIEIMLWCGRMDLVALANVKGSSATGCTVQLKYYGISQVKLLYIDCHGREPGL